MRRLWITLAALGALAGCDSGAIGSTCSGAPNEDGLCVEGAVCTPARSATTTPPPTPNADTAFCRKICDTQSDCADTAGYECREVPGSMLRACQPQDDPSSTDAGT